MGATGSYWKPTFNLLEGRFEIVLVNAHHIKQVPGRKTEVKDCEWIAQLLQHGLLRASFIPPQPTRQLTDLTRQRTQLIRGGGNRCQQIGPIFSDLSAKNDLTPIFCELFAIRANRRGLVQSANN